MKLAVGELETAVRALEQASGVEIVVAVRPRARVWLVQHAVVACVAAIGVLAYGLYGARQPARWELLVLPLAAALVGGLLVEGIGPLYRFLAPERARREHVRDAARAVFVEKGVHTTRERTGLLIYIAVREQIVELVGDLGVVQQVGAAVLARWADQLTAALPTGLARAIEALAPELAGALPRRADDANELGDAVVNVT